MIVLRYVAIHCSNSDRWHLQGSGYRPTRLIWATWHPAERQHAPGQQAFCVTHKQMWLFRWVMSCKGWVEHFETTTVSRDPLTEIAKSCTLPLGSVRNNLCSQLSINSAITSRLVYFSCFPVQPPSCNSTWCPVSDSA